MKKNASKPEQTVNRKTFRAVLSNDLRAHIPSLGTLTADALAGHIEALFDQYHPCTERLRPDQTVWPAVDENETSGYGKRIEECKIKPVILQVRDAEDIRDKLAGDKARTIRMKVTERLFRQAKDQGGVLTQADVGAILGLSPGTISKYVREIEKLTGELIPRRGTVHDMGPSLTHKREICRMVIVEGKTIEQTARDTNHSVDAVTRYVHDFRRIHACLENGLSPDQAAFAAGMSKRLVREYADMIEGGNEPCTDSRRCDNVQNN